VFKDLHLDITETYTKNIKHA